MKTRSIRRVFSAAMSAVLAFSAFGISAVSVTAASTEPGYDMAIRGVTEKFTLAEEIRTELNKYRTANNMSALAMDENLIVEAMQRAAELPIWTSTHDLMNTVYGEGDEDYVYAEAVAVVDKTMSAEDIVSYIMNGGTNTEGGYDLKTNTPTEVGVGAVEVMGNPGKLFVCIRETNSKTGTGKFVQASDTTLTQADTTVNVRSRVMANVGAYSLGDKISFMRFGNVEKAFDNSSTFMEGPDITINQNCEVSLVLNELEAKDSCAYIMPKIVKYSVDDSWFTNKQVSAKGSFRSDYTTKTVSNYIIPTVSGSHKMNIELYSANNAPTFSKTVTVTVTDGTASYTNISDCDISLEYESVESDGQAKTPEVTIYDGSKLLTKGTDYSVTYENNYSIGDDTAKVIITGMGSYSGTVIRTFSIVHTVQAELDITSGDYGYTGEAFTVLVKSGGTIIGTPVYEVTVKDPDGNAVAGTGTESTDYFSNWKYTFTPAAAGIYSVSAKMTDDSGKQLEKTSTIEIAPALTISFEQPEDKYEVGMTGTITANASGGFGTISYSFYSPDLFDIVVDGNKVSFSCASDGFKTLRVTATDEKGKSIQKTVTIDIVSSNLKAFVAGINLSLKGEIGVNLYMNIPDEAFKIVMDGPTGKKTYNRSDGFISTGDEQGKFKYSYFVAASEMNSDITVQVVDGEGNVQPLYNSQNTRLENDTYTFSVNKYFELIKDNKQYEDFYNNIKDLAENMSTFGSYAEKFFDKTDISGRTLTPITNVTADTLKDYKVKKTGTRPAGVKIDGFTLVVEDKTTFRFYLTIDEGTEITVYVNGEKATVKKSANGTYVEIPNIAAQELGTTKTIKLVDTDSNEYIIECSALSYAQLVLQYYDGTGTQTELCELMKAMYNYYKAADSCTLLSD